MRAARRDLPALTRLWQACFGDTEAEVRAFWQALFDCTPVYLRRAPDGSPAAMLCALPAELVGDDGDAVPAAYLYAVCTAPALRGRGHCRLLLQEAEQDLAEQDVRAAVLVPAEESLFGFYARFGYRTVFTCRTETVPAARGDCSITPLTPDGWQSLRELQLYDSHLSYPPELLRWQETISRSSGAGLYRIETGDAVCCAAAERDGVDLRLYRIIYDCIEEIESAMKGMLAPKYREVVLGHAEVRQTYKVSGVGTVAGCYVQDGKIVRSCSVRVVRDGIVIHEGSLASLKRFKDDAREVAENYECGLTVEKFNDIKEGDIIEAFTMEEIPR